MTGKTKRSVDYSRYLPLLLTLTTNQNQTMTITIKMFHNIQKVTNFYIPICIYRGFGLSYLRMATLKYVEIS